LHRKEWYNKVVGTWAYTKFMYSHFIDEHVQGHHKYIGTMEDPATSRKNEMFYTFIFRSIYGSHINTWNREVSKTKKAYGHKVSYIIVIIKNKMTYYFLLHLAIVSTIYFFLGWNSVFYQICYTCWGFVFLELINYIEHYGLQRTKDSNGIYESISKLHSWNSPSSMAMFRL
jgi:alkane 1-monooxygenase